MGAYLRSLKTFTVNADVTVEEVLDSGQKVENANTVEIAARRPDKLRVYTTSAERSRKIYYDGKTVTIFGEKLGYYGSFPAPATLGETVEVAAKKYGLEVPLADLFLMGTDKFDTKSITEAIYVGPQLIGGVLCDQLAFRQPGRRLAGLHRARQGTAAAQAGRHRHGRRPRPAGTPLDSHLEGRIGTRGRGVHLRSSEGRDPDRRQRSGQVNPSQAKTGHTP